MTKTLKYKSTLMLAVFAICFSKVHAQTATQTIELRQGWNAVSFVLPDEESLSSLPIEVEWILVFREPNVLVANRTNDNTPLNFEQLLPDELKSNFSLSKKLELGSIKPHEGCLVYSRKAITVNLKVGSLTNLSPIMVSDKWQLMGFPIGSYASFELNMRDSVNNNENRFSIPREVPLYTFLSSSGNEDLTAKYLKLRQYEKNEKPVNDLSAVNDIDLSKSWVVVPAVPKNGSWREDWRLKQSEAIWVKKSKTLSSAELVVSTIEDVKVELDKLAQSSGLPPESPPPWQEMLNKATIVSMGDSLPYVDVKFSRSAGDAPVSFSLNEVEWFKADSDWYKRSEDGVTKKETLLSILNAASASYSTDPGEGFEKIDEESEEPLVSLSSQLSVLPHLESTHGPWSSKRSIRINTERKTKGKIVGNLTENRILEPGIYLGRFELISSAANHENHPNLVILIEVPELYGGYQGSISAQVLSVRGDEPEGPKEFFSKLAATDGNGRIPFGELIEATKPNTNSIQIGTFPIRLRLLPKPNADKNRPFVQLVKDGSFLVNEDMVLNGFYDFFPLQNDFHSLNIKLDKKKKTLFLQMNIDKRVSLSQVPLLGAPETEESASEYVEIRRDVQMLLQEDSSGVLRGVFIEKLGRSKGGDTKGGMVRGVEVDAATSIVNNFEKPIYIVGEATLVRTSSKEQEQQILDKEVANANN